MGGPPGSQVSPLPTDLPFRVVSKTIGSGAYATIRKATPLHTSSPVIAVKFINKAHAFRVGRLRPKQLHLEMGLHNQVNGHANVIRFLSYGQDDNWVWLCMELADGGDLFDKIEADEGVGENVAHFYFTQLVAAIGWCHGRGVAHRDIKPENMLLAADGNLKLADFGLATQFLDPKSGSRKRCAMVCGSPPYIAPEILDVGKLNSVKRRAGSEAESERALYNPQIADVWSCAIVLFVLLAGNTPWDSPDAETSAEYVEYLRLDGRIADGDELWDKVPSAALSLLRATLRVDPEKRFSLTDVRMHPWFTRSNSYLNSKGQAAKPLELATEMLENLHIDFSQEVTASQRRRPHVNNNNDDAMDIDEPGGWTRLAATQPDTPLAIEREIFDWEAPPRIGLQAPLSQPAAGQNTGGALLYDFLANLAEDPSMSQFAPTPSVPISLTQYARNFNQIMPSHTLARFLSTSPLPALLQLLLAAFHRLNIPYPAELATTPGLSPSIPLSLRIKTMDSRQQPLSGLVIIDKRVERAMGRDCELLEVYFQKHKGDPLGWRRLFKQVAVLCKEAIVKMPQ